VNKGRGWHTVARTKTGARGRFHARFRPHGLGRYRLRVRLVGPVAASSVAGLKPAALHTRGKVTVYRQTFASWYGPGFMGGRTACGSTLGNGTLGVANKTLPCGTRVTFHYGSHTVTARVVDRGPYVAGREWDLTPAVKARLHFASPCAARRSGSDTGACQPKTASSSVAGIRRSTRGGARGRRYSVSSS
jgi:rare lipoprotein A (peptidoglycan hydrolase)